MIACELLKIKNFLMFAQMMESNLVFDFYYQHDRYCHY
jgi:hypothetical protein